MSGPGQPAKCSPRTNVFRNASDRFLKRCSTGTKELALPADPNFPPAWHNLADLLDERGRLTEAVDCEWRALTADPQYADAMFNLALFLQRLGNHAEAATWWMRYLERDRTSQWAERAKRALKYCEMEMATASTAAEPAEATGRS
jgi:tetratricopeptide (TPR) repeat protein